MIGNKCLLDTCIIINTFKKHNKIGQKLDLLQEIYVPVTVEGELYFGAYNSGNIEKHLTQIQSFLNRCLIIAPDSKTADIYGNIKSGLKKKGKPIPENDIWIAAIAYQYNLPIFTTDKHFAEIDNITLF